MKKLKLNFYLILFNLTLWFANVESAHGIILDTLPKGVYSAQFNFGVINNLNQSYGPSGKLWNESDLNFINFNAEKILELDPDAERLIETLDSFGTQNLGQEINFGTIIVDSKPQIEYRVAALAYGVTHRWSLAFAIPLIRYTNSVTLNTQSGNLSFYRSQFGGNSAELDQALNINLVNAAHKLVHVKDFKPLNNRNQEFIGDIQLHSFYKWSLDGFPILHQLTLILPTGPIDDPDDLLSLDRFHRTEVVNLAAIGITLPLDLILKPYVAVGIPLPESLIVRVPKNESDLLPAVNQKEELKRLRGPTAAIGSEIEFNLSRPWSILSTYQYSLKNKDSYSGKGTSSYYLLERDTDQQAQQVSLALKYSTLQMYVEGNNKLPITAVVSWSDIVAGESLAREQIMEIVVRTFF